MVVCFRRDLAPQLKSLMGPWWFSQFDPVSEVSQVAKRSLQVLFPSLSFIGVLHCLVYDSVPKMLEFASITALNFYLK